MQITFKLYANLTDFLPVDRRHSNQMQLEVDPGATISQIIAPFQLPMAMVHLVLINGRYIAPELHSQQTLQDGDVLAIWPPIAGG
jgi:sulfur carrier protein ThiS